MQPHCPSPPGSPTSPLQTLPPASCPFASDFFRLRLLVAVSTCAQRRAGSAGLVCPDSAHSLPGPWNILPDRSVCFPDALGHTREANSVTYGGGLHLCRVWRQKVQYSQPCLCDCPQQTPWTPRPGWASLVDHTYCVLSVVISREAVIVVCPCEPGPSAGFSLNPFTLTNHNHKAMTFLSSVSPGKTLDLRVVVGTPQTHCATGGWTELS